MAAQQGDRFEIHLQDLAQANDSPAVVRLRKILKALLRYYGFRCTFGRPLPAADAQPSQAGRTQAETTAGPPGD